MPSKNRPVLERHRTAQHRQVNDLGSLSKAERSFSRNGISVAGRGRAVLAVCAVYSGPDAFGRVLRHVCGRGGGPRVWGFTVGKPTPVSRFLLGARNVGTDGNGHTSRTARGASATQTPRARFLKGTESDKIIR